MMAMVRDLHRPPPPSHAVPDPPTKMRMMGHKVWIRSLGRYVGPPNHAPPSPPQVMQFRNIDADAGADDNDNEQWAIIMSVVRACLFDDERG